MRIKQGFTPSFLVLILFPRALKCSQKDSLGDGTVGFESVGQDNSVYLQGILLSDTLEEFKLLSTTSCLVV